MVLLIFLFDRNIVCILDQKCSHMLDSMEKIKV